MKPPANDPHSLAAAVPHDAARTRDGRLRTVALTLSTDQLAELTDAVADRLAQPSEHSTPWLSSEQAADYIAALVSRIHDLVGLGKLTPRRDGRRSLFTCRDLNVFAGASA